MEPEDLRCSFVANLTGGTNTPRPPHAAGADIHEISTLDAEAAAQRRYLEDLCNGMRDVKKPLLAAVEGIAVR